MSTGVLVIHFGEPPEADPDVVREYLTNIFLQNADLEEAASPEERARKLAERRLPGLLEEYEEIGGSPMNEQAREQAARLEREFADRGHDVQTAVAFQFMDPSIETGLTTFEEHGVEEVVALPIYPLCGPSTTVAALESAARLGADKQSLDVVPVAGWHRHPTYLRLRAHNLSASLAAEDIDPTDSETTLLFSAHGTPLHYLEDGSRYRMYVEEFCRAIASLLDIETYEIGYQNHANRGIPWTQPDLDDVIAELSTDQVVIEPVSFMHEQSETLAELDIDAVADAQAVGVTPYRVPIPHADPTFAAVLADVTEPFLANVDPAMYQLRSCECAADAGAYCLNAPRQP